MIYFFYFVVFPLKSRSFSSHSRVMLKSLTVVLQLSQKHLLVRCGCVADGEMNYLSVSLDGSRVSSGGFPLHSHSSL